MSSADFAIGISPALNQEYGNITQKVLEDLRSYRVRQVSSQMIFKILKTLPVWHPDKSRQTSVIFGYRDVPEIIQACQALLPADTAIDLIEGALHNDIFLLEATKERVINQLTEWFNLTNGGTKNESSQNADKGIR